MGLPEPPISLTWPNQHRLSALHGLISSATQPNMGLSAQPYSLTRGYQQRYSANMGLSAPLISLTWAYQHRLSA